MNQHQPRPTAGTGFRKSAALVPDLVAGADVLVILLAAVLPYLAYVPHLAGNLEYYVFCVLFIAGAAVVMLSRAGLYEPRAIMNPVPHSDMIIVSVVSAFLFFLTIAFSLKVSEVYSRVWIFLFGGASVAGLLLARLAIQRILQRLSRRRIVGRNLVVLGDGREAERFLAAFDRRKPELTEILGVFSPGAPADLPPLIDPESGAPAGAVAAAASAGAGSGSAAAPAAAAAKGGGSCPASAAPRPREVGGRPVAGDTRDLVALARKSRVDDIVIALPLTSEGRVQETVEALKELPVNVYIASQFLDFELRFNPALGFPRELPLFEVVTRPISGWGALLKSVEDYVLASLALLLLSPLMIAVAIAIRIDSPGPIFFRQPRLGFNNKPFDILKFRSMYHKGVPERKVQQATRDDPRVTPVGRFIRRTSIDELPQLFNVLNGTMSLVGPRPHALSHNEDYGRQIRGYFARHKVKPGITGWAQVNNLRGETETLDKMAARVKYDIYYCENWSLLFDLRILVMTVLVVLFQKTAY